MRTANPFASIVAAQTRAALPALSEISDAALKKRLPFVVTGSSESARGDTVLNGTVTHAGKTYKAAIFGMSDILAALDGAEPKVGLTLNLAFERTKDDRKGVFFARPKTAEEVAVSEAKAVVKNLF